MGRRLWALIRKEFIQIRRDRRTLAMMIAMPLIWLTIFGYAASFDVKEIPTGVINQSDSDLARRFVEALRSESTFRLNENILHRNDLLRRIDTGEMIVGLLIPVEFGRAQAEGEEPAQVEILVDGSNFFAAQTGIRALSPVLQKVAADLAVEQFTLAQQQVKAALSGQAQAISALQEQLKQQSVIVADLQSKLAAASAQRPGAGAVAGGQVGQPGSPAVPAMAQPPAAAEPPALPSISAGRLSAAVPKVHILYNPELRSANMMIPALTGLIMMFITSLMTALGVVREKEQGTLEQIVVSPIRPAELIIGKLIPYTVIGLLDLTLVVFAGMYIFDVPFAGNMPVFFGLSVLFLMSTLGLGLLISTMAQNQQQAIQMAMFMIGPQFLVSGFVFPLEAMPKVIQYISYLFPLTYFVPISRGMFMKGIGLDLLYMPAALIAVYGIAMITFASLRFRKRLG